MEEVPCFISRSGGRYKLEGKRGSVSDPDVLAAALFPLPSFPTSLSRLLT